MIKHLNLTEDHLKLVRFILVEETDNGVAIDKDNLLVLHTHLLDDVAMILEKMDKAIPNTSDDALGRAFDDETEEYLISTYNYVKDNLSDIESLLHQHVMDGIKAGKYKCKDTDMVWEFED